MKKLLVILLLVSIVLVLGCTSPTPQTNPISPTGSRGAMMGLWNILGEVTPGADSFYGSTDFSNESINTIPTKVSKQWLILDSIDEDYSGVAIGPNNNVYVTNAYASAIKKIYPNWVSEDIGNGLHHPMGVTVDNQGNVYVADVENNVVKKIDPSGSISSIGSGFRSPMGVAVDSQGDVYVADTGNQAVKMVYPNGTTIRLGDLLDPWSGDQDYYINVMNSGKTFEMPQGVAVDNQRNVYVANFYGGVNEIFPNNTTIWLAENHQFHNLQGIAVDAFGNVYVSERNNGTVDVIYPNGTVVALGGFVHPNGVAVDSQGNLYITDDNTITELSPPQNTDILPYFNVAGNPYWILILLAPILVFIVIYPITTSLGKKWLTIRSIAYLYLKIYLSGAAIYMLINILAYNFLSRLGGPNGGFFLFAIGSFIFGLVFSIVSGSIHILKVKSKYPISSETINTRHVREITVNLPQAETFDICIAALKTLKSIKIKRGDQDAGKIEARTPLDKKIELNIHRETDTTKIRVEIRPIMPFTFSDNGRNLDAIETICKFIENHNRSPGSRNEMLQ
ncbi:MAG TPA: hypothetical protein VK436_03780 [Methanocella sp.]|nr:hypothetical protein [Methanocella sp.]